MRGCAPTRRCAQSQADGVPIGTEALRTSTHRRGLAERFAFGGVAARRLVGGGPAGPSRRSVITVLSDRRLGTRRRGFRGRASRTVDLRRGAWLLIVRSGPRAADAALARPDAPIIAGSRWSVPARPSEAAPIRASPISAGSGDQDQTSTLIVVVGLLAAGDRCLGTESRERRGCASRFADQGMAMPGRRAAGLPRRVHPARLHHPAPNPSASSRPAPPAELVVVQTRPRKLRERAPEASGAGDPRAVSNERHSRSIVLDESAVRCCRGAVGGIIRGVQALTTTSEICR